MSSSLTAISQSAASLFSSNTFRIPAYQREYAWRDDQVDEFWADLSAGLDNEYFLGLVILTKERERLEVVDGQQRLLTLTLLAVALRDAAVLHGRNRLASQIEADFLYVLDFDTDETAPRITLTDPRDNATLSEILAARGMPSSAVSSNGDLSTYMIKAYHRLARQLAEDLKDGAFRKMGVWADFLTHRLYFAVFVHPDAGSAYRVFAVVNTRGRELTPAELLKNYVLGETPEAQRETAYSRWKRLSDRLDEFGDTSFVGFIRAVAICRVGYVLPKALYDVLSGRYEDRPMDPDDLLLALEQNVDYYCQILDPTESGPADAQLLKVFEAFSNLGLTAARPLLLALRMHDDAVEIANKVLMVMVTRLFAGVLGVGGIERVLGDLACTLSEPGDSARSNVEDGLQEFAVDRDDFERALQRARLSKSNLTFLRRSILQRTMTPDEVGTLHFIRQPGADLWPGWSEEEAAVWEKTIGNTLLATVRRRPHGSNTVAAVRDRLVSEVVGQELVSQASFSSGWSASDVQSAGLVASEVAGDVWYA